MNISNRQLCLRHPVHLLSELHSIPNAQASSFLFYKFSVMVGMHRIILLPTNVFNEIIYNESINFVDFAAVQKSVGKWSM